MSEGSYFRPALWPANYADACRIIGRKNSRHIGNRTYLRRRGSERFEILYRGRVLAAFTSLNNSRG